MSKSKYQIRPLDEPLWDFPYEAMEIGDSFFIPTMKPAYMTYVLDTTAKKVDVQVKVFTVVENGVLGVRAWRSG